MHRVAAKYVLHLLTVDQKENHVIVSQERFDHSNVNKNFLKNVITVDVTWLYVCDVETSAVVTQM